MSVSVRASVGKGTDGVQKGSDSAQKGDDGAQKSWPAKPRVQAGITGG